METRRTEMVCEADTLAESLGLEGENHRDLLSAIVWQECAERTCGDADRTRMVFDWGIEAIVQNQSRDALENIIQIVREAADEYLADPDRYITAEQEQEREKVNA